MKVDIYSNDEIIGSTNLDSFDPAMGVAIGTFAPEVGYKQSVHAFVIDGDDNPSFQEDALSARGPKGPIECVGVAIADFQEGLG